MSKRGDASKITQWENYANPCMGAFGRPSLFEFARYLPGTKFAIICGSGTGQWAANVALAGHNVVLIDPKPGSFGNKPVYRKPDYPTISDYCAHLNGEVPSATLWLNWSDPNTPPCRFDNCKCDGVCDGVECAKNCCVRPYDMEAIYILNPPHIVIMFEFTGGAGSTSLHKWLTTVLDVQPRSPYSSRVTGRDTQYNGIKGYREVVRMTKFVNRYDSTAEYITIWLTKSENDVIPCPQMLRTVAKHNPTPPPPTIIDMAYHRSANNAMTSFDMVVIALDGLNMLNNCAKTLAQDDGRTSEEKKVIANDK